MSFYSNVEKIIKEQGEDGLRHLEFYNGIDLIHYRQRKGDAYSKVHGTNSGQPVEEIGRFLGILQGDDFFEANSTQKPGFLAGFLYVSKPRDILTGDVIKVVSEDGNGSRYKITKIEKIGLTTDVLKRYKLSAMGDQL